MVNAAGVTAAMLVDKNKRVSLRWEINSYLPEFNKKRGIILSTDMTALSRQI